MMTNDNNLFLGFSVLGPPIVGQISVWFAETVGITGHNCLLGARRLNSSALAHQADQGFEMFLAQAEDPLLFGCSPGKAVQWEISWYNHGIEMIHIYMYIYIYSIYIYVTHMTINVTKDMIWFCMILWNDCVCITQKIATIYGFFRKKKRRLKPGNFGDVNHQANSWWSLKSNGMV